MVMFNFSDAYRSQGFLSWLESRLGDALLVCDFREVSGTSCYLDPSAREMLSAALPRPLPRVRWMDSGDYHYMSHLLALEETEPFHLVLLDNHADNRRALLAAAQALMEKGCGYTLSIIPGADHSEASWARRVPDFMRFLGF